MASNFWIIKQDVMNHRLQKLKDYTNEFLEQENLPKLSFSLGNKKTDLLVHSISLRPVLDCGNCKSCSTSCYDLRNDLRFTDSYKSRCKNYAVWNKNPKLYFSEISLYCKRLTAFRWHIGGDIINEDYLKGMISVAKSNKHCKFLVFTKMFDLCNSYFEKNTKPRNLQIIYSGWVGMDVHNPHNFPMAHPIFADGRTSAKDGARFCSGNCSECLIEKKGCWTLKKGEEIMFVAH